MNACHYLNALKAQLGMVLLFHVFVKMQMNSFTTESAKDVQQILLGMEQTAYVFLDLQSLMVLV